LGLETRQRGGAVRCAAAIQEALGAGADGAAAGPRLAFRIGVNLGDVMIDGDDLFGDGVNVAERLQALAAPGGVMVSGAVRALAHKQLAFGFDYPGAQQVKSLAEPVEAWALRLDGANRAEPGPPETATGTATGAETGAAPPADAIWDERALDWDG
jgi:Adenylate cyclase, family 3 (some proteins contain HAMP domain)